MSKFKWLRGFGPVGTTIANILVFLTTNWGVVVSIAFGLLASIWATAYNFFSQPHVGMAIFMFLIAFWTYIGFVILIDRTKPQSVRAVPDYRYGLTFEGIFPGIDALNDAEWLTFALQIRNFSQAPIKYTVEKFDLRIGSRALPEPTKTLSGYLPRGGGKTIAPSKFNKDEVREFFGKRVRGTAKMILIYGHPEEKPIRRLTIEANITLQLPTDDEAKVIAFGADIVNEADQPILGP